MITITLPPELGEALTERAQQQGTTADILAIDSLEKLYLASEAQPEEGQSLADYWANYIGIVDSGETIADMTNGINKREAEMGLIMQARQELSPALWRRFRQLTKKRRDDTLSEDEYTELLSLGDTLELHHAARIEASAQLARLWKRDLKEVMRILGVRPRHV